MPVNYAGEPRRIRVRNLTDFDGNTLGQSDIATMEVTIYNSSYTTVILATSSMTWHVTLNVPVYIWDTTGVGPGTYKAKVRLVTASGHESLEYQTIRLRRDPTAA